MSPMQKAENNITDESTEKMSIELSSMIQKQMKKISAKKKKVRFAEFEVSAKEQFVERCANVINVLRLHMQRDEQ
jgi:hypothetical protein